MTSPIATTREIQLSTGMLTVNVTRADWPLDDLCGFAARQNPRRAFLVVSKVLGRHIPVRPSVMRASFRDLAAQIPADLPGPVLVLGMAETAICLGQGVHEELVRRTGRADLLSLHSTRQQLDHPILCRFEEPHSHASSHIIYRPEELSGAFAGPRSLVVVDDEISTGTTIANLVTALTACLPSIEQVVAVTLADWSGGNGWHERIGRPCRVVSLLSGSLRCEPAMAGETVTAGFDSAALAMGRMSPHRNFGRLGRSDIASEGDALADGLAPLIPARIRVLGTGEFTYPPFRLAERLEARGHDVVVQSTTRSPVQIGAVIAHKLAFEDNYGTGVANYLYNVDPGDDRMTIICHETPAGSIDPLLVEALGARVVGFGELG